MEQFGQIPKKLKLINCVGGGSSSFGFWNEFMHHDKKKVEFIGVEAGGPEKSRVTLDGRSRAHVALGRAKTTSHWTSEDRSMLAYRLLPDRHPRRAPRSARGPAHQRRRSVYGRHGQTCGA